MSAPVNHLLVIDDDKDVCEFIRDVAEEMGFGVSMATSFDEFEQCYRSTPPSAIMLDLNMPDVDGIEYMQWLTKNRCDASLILFSGYDTRVLDAARRVGAERGLRVESVMEKPITVAGLQRRLEQIKQTGADFNEEDIERAIVNGEFYVEFLPKIRLSSLSGDAAAGDDGLFTAHPVQACEALARWRHPTKGVLMPADFIPVAERQPRLIGPLTHQIAWQALKALSKWTEQGIDTSVAVNLSAGVMGDTRFADDVLALIQRLDVDPDRLIFEITETAAMANHGASKENLMRLRLKNFRLSMDDFGTSYSSLAQLYRMPFSELKIDRSLIKEMPHSKEAVTIVRAIIDLAHNLELAVCAEGVEDRATANRLLEFGCDSAQGYFFSSPLGPAETEKFLLRVAETAPHALWEPS